MVGCSRVDPETPIRPARRFWRRFGCFAIWLAASAVRWGAFAWLLRFPSHLATAFFVCGPFWLLSQLRRSAPAQGEQDNTDTHDPGGSEEERLHDATTAELIR